MAVASMITLLYTATYILVAFVLPAYNTYKALEHHGDHDVRAWGIYWVVLAAISCLHYVVDCALCWLPGYYAIKLGFIVALWHPSVRLAEAMYDKVLSPLLATYESDIDMLFHQTKARGIDFTSQQVATARASGQRISSKAAAFLTQAQGRALQKPSRADTTVASAPAGAAFEGTGAAYNVGTEGRGLHTD